MSWCVRICGVLLSVLLLGSFAYPQDIRVAAASDLTSALPAIAQQFEQENHCKVTVTFGSSGNFFQQLENGAPFDVFLSADRQYPEALDQAGLTVPGSRVEYATGRLVLWARSDSAFDVAKGLKGLTSPAVKKIAMANPRHAPYGKAGEAALRTEGVYEQVSSKLVLGENVSQAATFAQTGNADAGILPLSLALNPTMQAAGHYVQIPASEYPPIRQAAVAMKHSKNPDLAKKFVQFLSNDAARRTLREFGFDAP